MVPVAVALMLAVASAQHAACGLEHIDKVFSSGLEHRAPGFKDKLVPENVSRLL